MKQNTIQDCKLIDLRKIHDMRGNLMSMMRMIWI